MKLTPLATWLLSSLCAIATIGCQKNGPAPEAAHNWCATPPTTIRVSYAQTQCADPWGQAREPQQFYAEAKAYLTQQGIAFTQLPTTITNQDPIVCNACICPTGVVLEGTVSPADLPAVLALGFRQ
jgi:hypothetical protein